jgi:prepilin-type N-terminal cleavage/methylation domain-containing protein
MRPQETHDSLRLMQRHSDERAFTLIELFTVMAVVAILFGLAFPAFIAVMERARKTQAKNDLTQILTAVNAYYTEYGKYPLTGGTDVTYTGATAGIVSGSSNAALIDVLRNNTASVVNGTIVTTWNPRGIVFIQPPTSSVSNPAKSGLDSAGVWHDPWGSPYNVMIDGNYDNQITNPYTDTPGGSTLYSGVVTWAFGKNGALGGGPPATGFSSSEGGTASNFSGSGDVISWQ